MYARQDVNSAEWRRLHNAHVAPIWDRDRYGAPGFMPADMLTAYERASHESGCDKLNDRAREIADQINDVEIDILETPAETVRGVLVKAQFAWGNEKSPNVPVDFDAELGVFDIENMLVHIIRGECPDRC